MAFAHLFIFIVLASGTNGQECKTYENMKHPGEFDIKCRCMQKLRQFPERINTLTISQSGCTDRFLEVDWRRLQSQLSVKKVVLDNAKIKFKNSPQVAFTSSLEELILNKCEISNLRQFAFRGLTKLRKVEISETYILRITSLAFAELPNLRTISIDKTNVSFVFPKAFDLDNDFVELFIIDSIIDVFYYNAVTITSNERVCSRSRSDVIMDSVMAQARSLQEKIDLPEEPKIFIFGSHISRLMHHAFETNGLGFVIVAGSSIDWVEENAFSNNLQTGCPITAFMLLGNEINVVSPDAFAGISGSSSIEMGRSYIAFARNQFKDVAPGSFAINETLNIFSVDSNEFSCDCDELEWVSINNTNTVYPELRLEKELLMKSYCFSGTSLINYLNRNCNANIPEPTATVRPVLEITEIIQEKGNPVKKEQSAVASSSSLMSNVFLLVVTIFVNKI